MVDERALTKEKLYATHVSDRVFAEEDIKAALDLLRDKMSQDAENYSKHYEPAQASAVGQAIDFIDKCFPAFAEQEESVEEPVKDHVDVMCGCGAKFMLKSNQTAECGCGSVFTVGHSSDGGLTYHKTTIEGASIGPYVAAIMNDGDTYTEAWVCKGESEGQ